MMDKFELIAICQTVLRFDRYTIDQGGRSRVYVEDSGCQLPGLRNCQASQRQRLHACARNNLHAAFAWLL